MLQQTEVGRWNLYIGQERGNCRIEVRQMKTGRPWSDMAVSNVVQLPALGNPSIDQMNTAQDHIYGWATPGATVKVHAHGVFIRDIGTDASGRWWTHLGFERGNTTVEAQQRVVGRPWSRMVKNGSTTITTNATAKHKSNNNLS